MSRHTARYDVRLRIGDAYQSYPADVYRVDVEWGALMIRKRREYVVCPGDSDDLIDAFGAGGWFNLQVIYKDDDAVQV